MRCPHQYLDAFQVTTLKDGWGVTRVLQIIGTNSRQSGGKHLNHVAAPLWTKGERSDY